MDMNASSSGPVPAAQALAFREAATPIVIVGHVDHGKSTLIGRLLYDTGSLQDGKLAQIVESSARRGLPVEWSFLLDSLQIERDQGVTVDSTRIPFRMDRRDFVIVDAPGHRQFLRNMITGAADAEAAVLVVDALEGAQEQTRRHAMLLRLIGISHVIVLMNKVDLLDYDQERIARAEASVRALLGQLDIPVDAVVPASAREGDNIALQSPHMPWYDGPTLTQALVAVPPPSARGNLAFRMPVQDVYRIDDVRFVAGRVERGQIRVGDTIVIGAHATVARVAEIGAWSAPAQLAAIAGQSTALRLEPDVIPDRGDLLHAPGQAPIRASRIRARLFWLRQTPLRVGESFTLRLATAEHQVTIASIDALVDMDDLIERAAADVPPEGIAEITLAASEAILFDPFAPGTGDGRGVLVDRFQQIVGGVPLIGAAGLRPGEQAIHPTQSRIDHAARTRAFGHAAAVFWMTGLSGAGKSAIARAAEALLFDRGIRASVLDGDTLRSGLCADLGFSAADRTENLRRAAHVAKILAESGQVVIAAFIAPDAAGRAESARIVGHGFHEVHVAADLPTCEARDPKGLYALARAGGLHDFTGIDAPYEPPLAPSLTLPTDRLDLAESASRLACYIADTVKGPAA